MTVWMRSAPGHSQRSRPRRSCRAAVSRGPTSKRAQEALDGGISQLDPHPDVTITATVVEGWPPQVLLDEATVAEMLVVGTRGLGGAAELLLGSTSHTCSHRSPLTVVIVPSDRCRSRRPS
jgi:nucleotide-binding universal stress UspA family protein